jgi:hypothetical protein
LFAECQVKALGKKGHLLSVGRKGTFAECQLPALGKPSMVVEKLMADGRLPSACSLLSAVTAGTRQTSMFVKCMI